MKKITKIFILFVVYVSPLITEGCSGKKEPTKPSQENSMKADNNVVAHRSGAKEAGLPDNSIAALKYAISLGCYAAECDIYITKDDSVVVCHTENNNDAIYGGKIIYNSTYQELKNTQKLSNGEPLPLLQDFLKVAMNSPFTKLWLDVKTIGENNKTNKLLAADAGIQATKIIRRMGAQSRVEMIVGRKLTLDKISKKVNGEWDIAYMNDKYTPKQFVDAGYDWANFPISAFLYKPNVIKSYKDMGIKVSLWNADTKDEMIYFINKDMYAICTNYPDKLLKLEKKLKN